MIDEWRHAEALDTIERLTRERDEARAEVEGLRDIVRRLVEYEAREYGGDPQGPHHAHLRAGIWDEDNDPAIAGKECEWCRAWQDARAALEAL